MSVVSRVQIMSALRLASADERSGEICMFLHREMNDIGFYDKEQVNERMLAWRRLRKQGKLRILEDNNKDDCKINGKQYYVLVVGSTNPNGGFGMDPTGLGWDDRQFLVDGHIYYFQKKVNRDMVYKYVMGIRD
jgi:hypothetical protein